MEISLYAVYIVLYCISKCIIQCNYCILVHNILCLVNSDVFTLEFVKSWRGFYLRKDILYIISIDKKGHCSCTVNTVSAVHPVVYDTTTSVLHRRRRNGTLGFNVTVIVISDSNYISLAQF